MASLSLTRVKFKAAAATWMRGGRASARALGTRPALSLTMARQLHATPLLRKVFKLSDIGEGIVQVELTKWHVKPGDKVKEFDVLCEVQSDKATVEITSRYAGVVRSLGAKEGDTVKVGSVLVDFADEGGDSQPSHQPPPSKVAPTSPAPPSAASGLSQPTPPTPKTKAEATPAVRFVAKEYNVNIDSIAGTGKDGRVTKEDVLAAAGKLPSRPPPSTSAPVSYTHLTLPTTSRV